MQVNNITLNFLEKYCLFYDWLKDDDITILSNLLLTKVSSSMINDLITYEIKINEQLKNNMIIFTDEYSFVAIEFNEDGKSIYKSSLLLADERRLEKKLSKLKYSKYKYEKLHKENQDTELRINNHIKKTILLELSNLKKENNKDKIAYLYYEWFTKNESNIEKMIDQMQKKLDSPIGNQEKAIFNLIKMSYKLV